MLRRGRDHIVGAAIAALYVAWLLATSRNLGFARDEGFYFHSATAYARWFEQVGELGWRAFSRPIVDAAWHVNHEHPSLMKSAFALSWLVLHRKLHLFADASTAFRFPGMLMAGASLWITYVFGARAYSRAAGAIAAGCLALMPHYFYHAHLACFDVPIVTMWLLSVYVFWRSHVEGTLRWAIVAGLVYGLTLETKHNAWILPAVFVPVVVLAYLRAALGGKPVASREPLHLLMMATLGPIVFVSLWPWLWFDTVARVREYVSFHVNHDYYNIEFFGRNYFGPPSPVLYAPVLIVASVPTTTLLLFAVGAFDRARTTVMRLRGWLRDRARRPEQDDDATDALTDVLIMLAFAAPVAVFFLPRTPIFGGTKHWMPAYPFLALLAGRGFDLARGAFVRAMRERVAMPAHMQAAALGACTLVGPLAITSHSHPFGLATYVPVVGGVAGGADLGLNRQFWGYATPSVSSWIAAHAAPGAKVFIHDTSWPSWERLIAEKRVRPDLRGVGTPAEADIALVYHELHMNEVDYAIWIAFGRVAPAHVVEHDGVPIISVYVRR